MTMTNVQRATLYLLMEKANEAGLEGTKLSDTLIGNEYHEIYQRIVDNTPEPRHERDYVTLLYRVENAYQRMFKKEQSA